MQRCGSLCFEYKGKKYYFKSVGEIKSTYNELVAYEIAREFNLPCVSYDLAVNNGMIGVVSESFLKDAEGFIPMETLFLEVYGTYLRKNNLENIWLALNVKFSEEQVNKFMDFYIKMFIFDAFIANTDRHDRNYGFIMENEKINLAPLFDNELMLGSLDDTFQALKVNSEDTSYDIPFRIFLSSYGNEYFDFIKSKLHILEDEFIEEILQRVEKKIKAPMQPYVRKEIIKAFQKNKQKIKESVELFEKNIFKKTLG